MPETPSPDYYENETELSNQPETSLDNLLNNAQEDYQSYPRILETARQDGLFEEINALYPLDENEIHFWVRFIHDYGILVTDRIIRLFKAKEATLDDLRAGRIDLSRMQREACCYSGALISPPTTAEKRQKAGLPPLVKNNNPNLLETITQKFENLTHDLSHAHRH